MNKSELVVKKLQTFSRFDPGCPIKGSEGKDIPGSTALSPKSCVYFDSNPTTGGHFIEKYGVNDQLEKMSLTHDEAQHFLTHLKNHLKPDKVEEVKDE